MNRSIPTVSRRSLLAGAAGALAAPMLGGLARAAARSNSVSMVGYGGTYQDTLIQYVINPFTKETGIEVQFVPFSDLAKIKAMQLIGNVEWDICTGSGPLLASGSKQGFWQKLDPSMFDLNDLAIQPTSDVVVDQLYASGITWDPKKYGPGKHPTNFAEFFDLKKFPGRRSFRTSPEGVLEAALLADGVAPKDIYPLDVDRAYKVLDRIKSRIVWALATPQTVSLVQTGEVDFSWTFSGRVKATTEPGGGVPLAYSFEQNLFWTNAMAVLKGAPNTENAMKLMAYMLRPEAQARLQDQLGYAPVSKKAVSMLRPEVRKWLPDLSNPNSLTVSDEYWADNREALTSRFKEWLQS
ncbi:ABC transporter substrate-binding protein [Bradyrhizobium sp. 169]|uniref:ABC transporter substrate-binding protein n=1 Tax=Bradyrhizobium sp. 169 TaxID=2782640 RepID=UPI001FF89CBB|nr:ABC transporter substrate-binding protein [Bradyrhizobium sp. 169]MCK1590240.1 ABC transporter substrate-binding protein [Bradyrhizobium sp. 169]